MDKAYMLDPEVAEVILGLPKLDLNERSLPSIRKAMEKTWQLEDTSLHNVKRTVVHIPASDRAPSIRGLQYTPASGELKGVYLHLHGGGFVMGAPEMADGFNIELARDLGILVLSLDYRLAPEHPYPAALEDCYNALIWLHANVVEPRGLKGRLAIGGESAGGGLAAALAQHALNKKEVEICFQLLTYPMLDDRTGVSSQASDPKTGEYVWTRNNNLFAWKSYLSDTPPKLAQLPSRAESLTGLPSTWIGTAALDLFRDENIIYAQKLMQSGVPTELVVYPSVCHGFQFAHQASVSKRYLRDAKSALARGLKIGPS